MLSFETLLSRYQTGLVKQPGLSVMMCVTTMVYRHFDVQLVGTSDSAAAKWAGFNAKGCKAMLYNSGSLIFRSV
jgi:hypothetical protein